MVWVSHFKDEGLNNLNIYLNFTYYNSIMLYQFEKVDAGNAVKILRTSRTSSL